MCCPLVIQRTQPKRPHTHCKEPQQPIIENTIHSLCTPVVILAHVVKALSYIMILEDTLGLLSL